MDVKPRGLTHGRRSAKAAPPRPSGRRRRADHRHPIPGSSPDGKQKCPRALGESAQNPSGTRRDRHWAPPPSRCDAHAPCPPPPAPGSHAAAAPAPPAPRPRPGPAPRLRTDDGRPRRTRLPRTARTDQVETRQGIPPSPGAAVPEGFSEAAALASGLPEAGGGGGGCGGAAKGSEQRGGPRSPSTPAWQDCGSPERGSVWAGGDGARERVPGKAASVS